MVYLVTVFVGRLIGNNELSIYAAGLLAAIAYAMKAIISKIEKG